MVKPVLKNLPDLLAKPASEGTWRKIVKLVEQARSGGDWAGFEKKALPLIAQAVATWPAEIRREAPHDWVERLCATYEDEDSESDDSGDEDEDEDGEDSEDTEADSEARKLLLGDFHGTDFPNSDGTFWGPDEEEEPRHPGHTPELLLANAILLGSLSEGEPEPFDVWGHAFLRDSPYVANLRTVSYEFPGHEFENTPLIVPEVLWKVLAGPSWKVEDLTLGRLHSTIGLDRFPFPHLRALSLIDEGDPDSGGPDPFEELPALATNPCLATVETLRLGQFSWSEELFTLLLGELRWSALREVHLLGLKEFHLSDNDLDLPTLISWITSRPLAHPATLVLVKPGKFTEKDLKAATAITAPGWKVRVD